MGKRLVSLDAFRGLTILLMLIVNNPGSWDYVYPPLRHAAWHGCTPTDMIFPFFLFIMGVAMWYSFKKYNNSINWDVSLKVIRRTLLIFLIGTAINLYALHGAPLSSVRIMGVLPRIALAYGIASFMVLVFRTVYIKAGVVMILLAYWAALALLGKGDPFSLEGNFVRTFDTFLLGENHLPMYLGIRFDMSGLFSTIPSVAHVLFGYLCGQLIENEKNKAKMPGKLLLYGVLAIIGGKLFGILFPINKLLWSSSFVLYTTGWAMVLLSFFYWFIDIRGCKKWTKPLLAYGMNPLFIYVLADFWARLLGRIEVPVEGIGKIPLNQWIYTQLFVPLAGNMIGSLLFALHLGLLFWLIAWIMYKKRWFIKI
ncbi:MAG: hypothetical protein CSA96_02930 [Bacteroidetes bacterium]|nr:MAG: hypothetical protein CSA96_02930 [Bacteroidota bacterium]